MNENLNLVEILKDCPKWTKLYSPLYGDVELLSVTQNNGGEYPIEIKINETSYEYFTIDGRVFAEYDGECLLFPSKEQRDWSKFNPHTNQTKFDPNTLNPFDKVLARNDREDWSCMFFSHIIKDEETYPYACGYDLFTYCIPYNDDTKHLVGTIEEAPEFYRYWED